MSTSFYKSTFSGSDKTCVMIGHAENAVLIRDSKYVGPTAEQPTICIPVAVWPAVLDLTLSNASGMVGDALAVTVNEDGGVILVSGDTELVYTPEEWDAYMKGVADGQFDRN